MTKMKIYNDVITLIFLVRRIWVGCSESWSYNEGICVTEIVIKVEGIVLSNIFLVLVQYQ